MGTSLEKNFNYQEGQWAAQTMAARIDQTIYRTLKEAIKVKEELILEFEENFGYSREDENFPDRNYTYNLGILDGLKKIKDELEK